MKNLILLCLLRRMVGAPFHCLKYFLKNHPHRFLEVVNRGWQNSGGYTLRTVGFTILSCGVPFILWSDPCPNDSIPPLIESRGSTWDCTVDVFEDSYTNFIEVAEDSECGLRKVEIAKWNIVKGSCDDEFLKRYTIVWYAEDFAGNVSNFEQEITIVRPTLEDVEFPADTTVQCPEGEFENFDLYGYPTVNGNKLTDMCGFRVKSRILDTIPGWAVMECLPQVTKEWTVYENCTGLARIDTQTISLIDTIRPIIACTALEDTVTLAIDSETCMALYSFPETGAIDFCASDDELDFDYYIDGQLTGNEVLLMAGVYQGSIVVRDPCANADTCNFVIRVLDQTPPVVSCSPDTINLVELSAGIHISDLNISVSECTGEADLVYRFTGQGLEMNDATQTFTCDMVNTTVDIVVTATDTSGNQSESEICGIFVRAEGSVCNLGRSHADNGIRAGEPAARRVSKAYFDGLNLVLESPEKGIKSAKLYNLAGQLMWSKTWDDLRTRIQSPLPQNIQSGVYMISLEYSDDQNENIRIPIF